MTVELPPPFRGMGFCPRCGGVLAERLVAGETRERLVCERCSYIFYFNPKLVASCIPVLDGRVILGRRAIEPQLGSWTYPSGFVELGETVEAAAQRETQEEVNVEVAIQSLLNVYSRPQAGIVAVAYLGLVVGGEPSPGPEMLEVELFRPDKIPWDGLSFDSTSRALEEWVRSLRLPPAQ